MRQVADLIRYHREPHTGFARARRFYGRVQRQDVGLEGDLIHHSYDL